MTPDQFVLPTFLFVPLPVEKKMSSPPSTTYGFLTPIRARSKLMQCCTLGTVNCQFGTLCLARTLTLCLLRKSHCFRGLSRTGADVNLKDKHRFKHTCVHTPTHMHAHRETLKDNYAKTYVQLDIHASSLPYDPRI